MPTPTTVEPIQLGERTPDWTLLDRWRQGDTRAGDRLMRRYLTLLTQYFRRRLSSPHDVADLVADTLLACTRRRESIREAKRFRSFLFSTALNQLRRYLAKRRKRALEIDDFAQCCTATSDLGGGPDAIRERHSQTSLLVVGLRQLPLEAQVMLELSMFQNLRGPEIAELLGMPTATVYTRLRRSKTKLAAVVDAMAKDPAADCYTLTDLDDWATQLRTGTARPK
ncbi:MAG: sigma-70 family RNA polymerase sigma factor [Deltaproteobacteria bacterium]|nr:sigma-70 family RNA polymerase sigma factor [Deltaproteobacteria bacterium]